MPCSTIYFQRCLDSILFSYKCLPPTSTHSHSSYTYLCPCWTHLPPVVTLETHVPSRGATPLPFFGTPLFESYARRCVFETPPSSVHTVASVLEILSFLDTPTSGRDSGGRCVEEATHLTLLCAPPRWLSYRQGDCLIGAIFPRQQLARIGINQKRLRAVTLSPIKLPRFNTRPRFLDTLDSVLDTRTYLC